MVSGAFEPGAMEMMERIFALFGFVALVALLAPLSTHAAETEKIAASGEQAGSLGPSVTFNSGSSGDLIDSGTLNFTGTQTFKAITLNSPATITTTAVSFDDIFKETGFGVEFSSRFTDHLGVHAGVSLKALNGKTFDGFGVSAATQIDFVGSGSLTAAGADTIRVKMDDATEWGIYGGVKVHPLVFEKYSLYLRGDVGLLSSDEIKARFSLVSNPGDSIMVEFFEREIQFFGNGGAGVEIRMGNFDLQGEIRAEWRDKRAVADGVQDIVGSNSIVTYPVSFSLMWRF